MEISQHIQVVEAEGQTFASEARTTSLETAVPSCPGWNVRALVRHLGMIHLWAASHVAFPHDETISDHDEHLAQVGGFWPELGTFWVDDDDLIDWYLKTNTNLVRTLESASDDLEMYTFLPAPTPRAMWARRQAHETSVHRFDAQLAAGSASGFDPSLAADGIDEVVIGMWADRRIPVPDPKTILFHSIDTDDRWHSTLTREGVATVRTDGPADLVVAGLASDLYLTVWNRGDDAKLEQTGENELLTVWHSTVQSQWPRETEGLAG